MGMVIQDFGAGGGRPPDLWHFLQEKIPYDPLVWIRDLGDDPQGREDTRQISPLGVLLSGRNSTDS